MDQLPYLDFNHRIDHRDAWHDKIEWSLAPAQLTRKSEIDDFLNYLCCPNRRASEATQDNGRVFGWLFGSGTRGRVGSKSRPIRKLKYHSGGVSLPKPLLTGKVALWPRSQGALITFLLQINPSRMLHHHPGLISRGNRGWRHQGVLSQSNELPSIFDQEYSLDGSDNWVPQSEEYKYDWRRPPERTDRCIEFIDQALIAEIKRATEVHQYGYRILPDRNHSLRYLETYWEFRHRDPIRSVAGLVGKLKRISSSGIQIRNYPARGGVTQTKNKNSIAITLPLAAGEILAIYAKTNHRIRFEIRQNFTRNARSLEAGRMAKTRTDFRELLLEARQHCASRMQNIFTQLKEEATVPEDSATTTTFLVDLSAALFRSDKFSTIFALLLTNGTLSKVQGFASEISALRSAGIIESHGPRQNASYRVCVQYRRALSSLQRKGLASEFDPRDR